MALCRFSPPTWLHQSPYPALRPFLTQCLLLSQGPGIWGGRSSLFLSLSGGQLKGPSICQSCACWNGPRVWQEGLGGSGLRTRAPSVVSVGMEVGPGRDTLSTQGGVISCRSGEGCVPERVPCGDQNKFCNVSSFRLWFGEREEGWRQGPWRSSSLGQHQVLPSAVAARSAPFQEEGPSQDGEHQSPSPSVCPSAGQCEQKLKRHRPSLVVLDSLMLCAIVFCFLKKKIKRKANE